MNKYSHLTTILFLLISSFSVYSQDISSRDNGKIPETTNKEGKTNIFSSSPNENQDTDYGKNIIWFHLFDIVYNDFTFSYERILNNENIGIYMPIGIGIGVDEYGYLDGYNLLYSGLGLNFYPTGQGKLRYFFGPVVHAGYGEGYSYTDNYYYSGDREIKDFYYGKLLVNNGIMFSPTNNYSISAIASLGAKYLDKELEYHNDGVSRSAWFTIKMGYRF